jgi:hypothetical protein
MPPARSASPRTSLAGRGLLRVRPTGSRSAAARVSTRGHHSFTTRYPLPAAPARAAVPGTRGVGRGRGGAVEPVQAALASLAGGPPGSPPDLLLLSGAPAPLPLGQARTCSAPRCARRDLRREVGGPAAGLAGGALPAATGRSQLPRDARCGATGQALCGPNTEALVAYERRPGCRRTGTQTGTQTGRHTGRETDG